MKIKTENYVWRSNFAIKFLKIMRISTLLIMFSFLNIYAEGHSQSERLTIQSENISLRNLFSVIEKESHYKFLYSDDYLNFDKTVSLHVNQQPLNEILSEVFDKSDIGFKLLENNLIVIMPKVLLQQKVITGTVTDAKTKELLVGVSVRIVGTSSGTITDANGHYSLKVPNATTVLEFSFIGMNTVKEPINGRTLINVELTSKNVQLDEVVVTALGLSRAKKAIGYSQESVKGAELSASNAPNIINALSGKMAGINITSPNGVDGGTTRIIIGGNNTIQGDNQPLIIVDGMPLANEISGSAADITAPQDWGSAINMINSQDIDEISVLKGPAAAALYGGRGANGVVLITTKKGSKRQGLGIDYNFSYKTVDPYRYLKLQNEYGTGGMVSLNSPQYQKDGSGNPMLTDGWTQSFVDQTTGTGPFGVDTWNQVSWPGNGVSWGHKMDGTMIKWWDGSTRADVPQPNNMKLLYRNGSQTSHNVAISGGNEWGTMRVSYTRLDNNSIFPNSGFNQNTFNLGGNIKVSKRLSFTVNASYFDKTYNNAPMLGNSDVGSWQKRLLYNVGRDYSGDDVTHYMNADGSRNSLSGIPWVGNNLYQMWNIMENNTSQYSRKLLSSVQANYQATDFLDIMFRASLDNNNNEAKTVNNPTDAAGFVGGSYSHGLSRDYANNIDFLATFHKDNIKNSNINAKLSLGGTSFQRSMYSISGSTPGTQYSLPYLNYFGNYTGTVQTSQIPSESWYDKKLNSVYGFLNLSYKSYLFLDVTARNDWSSTLPKGEWSYFFPSVSGSFLFSDVIQLPEFISFGKLRLAWAEGATDNDPYRINTTYSVGSFAGQPTSFLPTSLPALHYKPAINNTADIGIELGFLKNRISLDARYYHGRSKNQILSSPLPTTSGVNSVIVNSGVLENSGVEFILKGKPIENKNFKWDIAFNFAHNSNKLLSLSSGLDRVDMNSIWGNNGVFISAVVGQQFGSIMGYDYVYDPKTHLPILQDAAMLAKNGYPASMLGCVYETTQQSGKMSPIGNTTPKLTGGVTNTFTFKNGFSISSLIDYKLGGQIWSGTYATMMQQGTAPETLKERDGGGLPYTTPDGTQTNWGVVLPGVYPDGTVNKVVVHYYYKYMGYGVWSSGPDNQNWIHSTGVLTDSWVKLRELSLNYMLPDKLVKKTKVFQSATISLVGRDLFYLYSSLPDNINPEGVNGAGNAQGIEFSSLPNSRSLSVEIRVSF
ncbi:MAG: SusC/RagA family TonB-linked outer membrane protein [Bacteroidetes bacterium]|nr:SusC/RagA family TonB-linked outer membrane protein [Bacteroidota bacterium]